jgi:hypothetical protein
VPGTVAIDEGNFTQDTLVNNASFTVGLWEDWRYLRHWLVVQAEKAGRFHRSFLNAMHHAVERKQMGPEHSGVTPCRQSM